MKKIKNTLYITDMDRYLSLDGENIVVLADQKELGRVPLHNIEGVITFGFTGVSPALMGACCERNVSLTFLSPSGRFLARIAGPVTGNVLLRKKQYAVSEDSGFCMQIASNIITAKLYNSRMVVVRAIRDHAPRIDADAVKRASDYIKESILSIKNAESTDSLRGIEGEGASIYFSVFDELILQQKEDFSFRKRVRRPPLDPVNALLSFFYTLLAGMYISALEAVGLDPYVGFFHRDRPGRPSLALDLMEELRSPVADRLALTLINKRVVTGKSFKTKENGAVLLEDDARREVIKFWQEKKKDLILHPFINEKMEWGMVPMVQAQLLARYLREDIDGYPPFFWR